MPLILVVALIAALAALPVPPAFAAHDASERRADWDLEKAADAMAKGGFRHLVVIENGQVAGIISMRDIIHLWRPR